jgi:LEA14-like dessication related protein
MKIYLFIISATVILFCSCGGMNHVKEPEYRNIQNVHLITLGPLQSTAGVDLVYYNPNKFSVQVAEAVGDIYLDSSFFGKFQLSDKVQVKKKSEFTLPALVKIDMINLLKNHRDLLQKKEALLTIQGTAVVKKAGFSRNVPIKFERMESIDSLKAIISTVK